jgi:hypothetical protein
MNFTPSTKIQEKSSPIPFSYDEGKQVIVALDRIGNRYEDIRSNWANLQVRPL